MKYHGMSFFQPLNWVIIWPFQNSNYSWLFKNTGVRDADLWQKSVYNFTVVSFYPWFLICTWTSTNHGSCSIVPSLLKKIICKCTCTVLTCILRGSVIMSFRSKELPCIASVTISSFPFSLYANLIVWILNLLYKCSSFLIISLPFCMSL